MRSPPRPHPPPPALPPPDPLLAPCLLRSPPTPPPRISYPLIGSPRHDPSSLPLSPVAAGHHHGSDHHRIWPHQVSRLRIFPPRPRSSSVSSPSATPVALPHGSSPLSLPSMHQLGVASPASGNARSGLADRNVTRSAFGHNLSYPPNSRWSPVVPSLPTAGPIASRAPWGAHLR
jgi:hypothetical protein